jgi:hypothetical protein
MKSTSLILLGATIATATITAIGYTTDIESQICTPENYRQSVSALGGATVGVTKSKREPVIPTTLLQFDFNDRKNSRGEWAETKPVGTIDTAGTESASGGLQRTGNTTFLESGLLPVTNDETNLAKLTLSFTLSLAKTEPVTVQLESFDAQRKRTGGLETTLYPAAPHYHQRFALELNTLKPFGGGTFQPTAPFVRVRIGGTKDPANELRFDNLHYAKPAYYVSVNGSDKNDGRTERTAFATPQKAVEAAGPGDIILVMNGTYKPNDLQEGVATFRRPGTPAAWITLKNYPGHQPVFSAINTWNTVKIGQRGNKETPSSLPALAYIEVRGLHLRGDSDVAKEKYAERIGEADARTNGNGLSILGRFETNKPHHIRIADNRIEHCNGGGISGIEADHLLIENNTVYNNCWWMIYAGSGISVLDHYDFDATINNYKIVIRNNIVSGNRCFIPWRQIKKISDGNGIIIDSNYTPNTDKGYNGRTLVQNNLSFNNGGSGIHSFKSHRVDIVNNTAYLNGASPELKWGQIFLQRTTDARVINNVLWARDGQPVNTVSPNTSDKENKTVIRANNLYFGGSTPPILGESDVIAAPEFIAPSTDPAKANFRLKKSSPAIATGRRDPFTPLLDLDGKPRGATPTKGAYEP